MGPKMYAEHRERLLAVLKEKGAAALIPTHSLKTRNHDCEYRFRPGSDFWYLSGFEEPGSALVLLPGRKPDEAPRSILFLRERDRERETWTGIRLGVEAAPNKFGVDEAHPIEELWSMLPELFKGYPAIVYRTGEDEAQDRKFMGVMNELRMKARGATPPLELLDTSAVIHEQRLKKSKPELEIMRRAAAITAEAHLAAMARAKPGVGENEIDALIEYVFKLRGSQGPAYTNIVAGGKNACILHYIENDQELKAGDLLLIDAGAELDCYASDVTRTFPVDGQFTPDQRAVYEVVLEAQRVAIEHVRPKVSFESVHDVAVRSITKGLIDLGILEGDLDEQIEKKGFFRYYMHRTGHWLGLDVHDCGSYFEDGESRRLEAGMVLTVEPGLYFAEDDETVAARWRGIGVRIEDDVVVTPSGHEVLTAAIPKEVDEVEAACRRAVLEPVG